MDIKQVGLGIVLFLVFWAFQAGYLDRLGTTAWVVGAIVFAGILYGIGKVAMPKPSVQMKELWMFATLLAVIVTLVISYGGPYIGAVFPVGFNPMLLTPLVLSFWLIIFGGALFVTGTQVKWGITTLTGVIWLFSSIHFLGSTGPNSYIHFALVTALPLILTGIIMKGK